MKQEKVIIIGGGPAGLMSAEIIATAGYNVKIFEFKQIKYYHK